MSTESPAPHKMDALLARLDVPGPRYTSYPTADRFHEAFGATQYRQALERRASSAPAPLSLYVHVPFCESVCYYCACNKVVTRHHERAGEYLQALQRELRLHVEILGHEQPVTQLHLGGGTPTFLSDEELTRLMSMLHQSVRILPAAEISIEIDPRTVDRQRLERLAALGFNRLSFGVQDFDPEVQKAVHREQPFEAVRALMLAAREIGFDSINADLICGLPRQTPVSFQRTVEQIGGLRPDRIALYAYAHLPQRFTAQRRIQDAELPSSAARVQMQRIALEGLGALGYAHIGMDHFALPGDALAAARREGRLQRNFQGYSTQPDCDLIGLGVSAISKVGDTYSQNAKTLGDYYGAMDRWQFAATRGLTLDSEDLLRRDVIMGLMCQGRVQFAAVEGTHGVRPSEHFSDEFQRLRPFVERELVTVDADSIEITPLGWYFVRAIAMVFDRHLQVRARREDFSRIV